MNKSFWASKTVWGFGLLGIALIGQHLGVIPENEIAEIIKVAFGLLGIFGLRSSID